MNKPKLDLLASLQLKEVTGSAGLRMTKSQKNPTNADIRLFADGSCYPSEALVEEFQLEYQDKDSDKPEYGFDIFETAKWGMWPASEHFVMISQVSKHAKKVDLFSKTSYDKDGHSRSSVLDQGASTFGKRLIEMLEQTYNEKLFANGNSFVDLNIVRDSPVGSTRNGIYNIPKMIVKGEKAGTYSFERRENITVYPLLIDEESLMKEGDIQDESINDLVNLGQEDPTEDANGQAHHEETLGASDAAKTLSQADNILGDQ